MVNLMDMIKGCFAVLLSLSCYAGAAQDDWLTVWERSGGTGTPRYAGTMEFCSRLAAASPMVTLTSFGKSAQGRDLPAMIVDRDGLQDPDTIKQAGRLILLIQACIHPGESEGKDAGLMLVSMIRRGDGT